MAAGELGCLVGRRLGQLWAAEAAIAGKAAAGRRRGDVDIRGKGSASARRRGAIPIWRVAQVG